MGIDLERLERLAAVARVRPWVLGAPGDLTAEEIGPGDLVEGTYAPPAVVLAREGEWLTLVPCARLGVAVTPSEVAFTLGHTTLVAQGWDARRVPAEALAGCAWQGTLSEDNLAGLRARLAEGCAEEARIVREDPGAAFQIVGYQRATGWPWELIFPGLTEAPGRVAPGVAETETAEAAKPLARRLAEAAKAGARRFVLVEAQPAWAFAAATGRERATCRALQVTVRDGTVACQVRQNPERSRFVVVRVCRTDGGERPLRLAILVGDEPIPEGDFTLVKAGDWRELPLTPEEAARGIAIVSREEDGSAP